MPELSDKKYPKMDVRLPPELDRRIRAEAVLDGVRPTTCARVLWEEALRARAVRRAGGAVEQASRAGVASGEPTPAPAEPPEEPYEPDWKKSLMTSGQRSNIGPRPKP